MPGAGQGLEHGPGSVRRIGGEQLLPGIGVRAAIPGRFGDRAGGDQPGLGLG